MFQENYERITSSIIMLIKITFRPDAMQLKPGGSYNFDTCEKKVNQSCGSCWHMHTPGFLKQNSCLSVHIVGISTVLFGSSYRLSGINIWGKLINYDITFLLATQGYFLMKLA